MKIKQTAFFLVVSIFFALTASSEELAYQESTRGNYLYLNPFSHKPVTSADHWAYATALREDGDLKSARKEFDILVKRWPESPQAAGALRAVGDIYFELGKDKEAFETYEQLIQRYYTGLTNYDQVLENQYEIARREMTRKRMKILFGGYTAPERGIPYLQSILRNAPQWDRAPELQFQIGEAYQRNEEYEMAVAAYTTVEYRYPDSLFAERASFEKIQCLKHLVEHTPYSVDLLEDAQLAVDIFSSNYPDSEYAAEIAPFAADLADRAAQNDFEIAAFYEGVPDPLKKKAARIYYEKVIEEHPDTKYAAESAARLQILFPPEFDSSTRLEVIPVAEGEESIEREPPPERLVADEEAVEVTADRMEYKDDLLIGEGNVAVQQRDATLQADYVSVNPDTGEITAMGNIVMLREGARWEGQELVYNFKTKQGSFGESAMNFEPFYIVAESTTRISSNEYRMVNVQITTCSGDDPIIYAKAKEVRLFDGDEPADRMIKAKHVTFYAGGVPVFYTPYWHRHLADRVFSYSIGYSGRVGAFVMGRARLPVTDWLVSTTHLDLYATRGIGIGQDFGWTTPNGNGGIKTYYIKDNDPFDDDDLLAERALIDSQRYRVRLDHREQFDDDTYLQAEFNYLSDPDILEDFFNNEFQREANPENYAVVQRATDQYAAGLRVDRRLNDFYTTVDRTPELSLDWYRSVLGAGSYVQSDNSLGHYEYLNASPSTASDYRSTRFDTYNQIFYPIRVKDFFNIIPRVAYRGTWYSDTPGSSAELRNNFEFGTLASFKAHKVLSDKSGFYGEGLRHIAEPYTEYLYRTSDMSANMLYQFDEIDTLDDRNEVRFGLRNFIQTKRGAKRTVNFLDADLFTAYRFDPESGENELGSLGAELDMSLTDQFRIQSDLEYDTVDGTFHDYNMRVNYTTDDQSRYAVEYRYLDGTRSLVSASAELFPNDDWSYHFMARYDTTWEEWRERRVMVSHRFDCLGLGLGVKVDEDDELSLWLQLWLTAFDRPNVMDRIR